MNTNPTTNKELTQLREHQVWELRIQCYSQSQIAAELGITQGAVSQILKRVRTRLAQEFAAGAAEMRAEQVEQLLHIAQEALKAWNQSKFHPAPLPPEESQTLETQTPSELGTGGQTAPSPPSLRSEIREGIANLDCPEGASSSREGRANLDCPEGASSSREGRANLDCAERDLSGIWTAPSPPSLPGKGAGGLGSEGAGGLGTPGKISYLRTAIQALSAIRTLWGPPSPNKEEGLKYDPNAIKLIMGVDFDHFKAQNGAPVPRKEVERIIAAQTGN